MEELQRDMATLDVTRTLEAAKAEGPQTPVLWLKVNMPNTVKETITISHRFGDGDYIGRGYGIKIRKICDPRYSWATSGGPKYGFLEYDTTITTMTPNYSKADWLFELVYYKGAWNVKVSPDSVQFGGVSQIKVVLQQPDDTNAFYLLSQ